jgi:hypothetical protein
MLVCYDVRYIEECAVASHAHGNVGAECIVDNFRFAYIHVHLASEKVVKLVVNGKLYAMLADCFKEQLYSGRLMLLIYIAE